MNTAVSVVVPVHNHGDSLASAVASVRAQEWPAVEIIIVDDGSVDTTAEVARALRADDVRIHHQDRSGPAEARNVGIRDARHPWIAFLDADDIWLPGKLRSQFEVLSVHRDAAFSYGDAWTTSPGVSDVLFTATLPAEALKGELLFGNRLATPTVLARRDSLHEVGLFDARLVTGEDWDLWLRLAWRFVGVPAGAPVARVRRTRRHRPNVRVLEECTFRVLDKFFSTLEPVTGNVTLPASRSAIYAWHRAVLAKSHLRAGGVWWAARLIVRGLESDPGAFLRSLRGRRPLSVAAYTLGS